MSKILHTLAVAAFLGLASSSEGWADCNISDAKLEEAILKKPEFRDLSNRQLVRDLRRLRDAAFILWSYGQGKACEQMLGHIRELVAAPSMASLGGSDEDEADQQIAAGEPIVQRSGAVIGNRGNADAGPLVDFGAMVPPLTADEILGSEVRTADDKIVGEVRNIVIGDGTHGNFAIVAAGGYFVPGKKSLVVPVRYLRVSRERDSFYLPLDQADLAGLPLMPDNDLKWVTDHAYLKRNDLLLSVKPSPNQ